MMYITVVILIGLAAAEKDLERMNAGVIFKSRGKVQSSTSFWYHTFALDLPTVPREWLHLATAEPVIPNESMSNLIALMNTEVVKALENMLMRARTLIPKHISPDQRRQKRFAPLSDKIFGTATVEDVERVSSHVNELIRRQRLSAKTMVADKKKFQSLVRLTDSRFNGLKKIFSDNNDAIKIFRELEISNTDNINQDLPLFINYASQFDKTFSMISNIRSLNIAIEELATGYICPSLVSGGVIEESIRGINSKIAEITNDRSHGVVSEKGFYSFFCRLMENSILITLKFQVASLSKNSHLYEVMVDPVQESKNSKHATMIVGLPEYVIITQDEGGRKYSPLTSVQLSQCRGKYNMLCPFNLIYTSISRENCLTSLIRDSPDISNFCDFRYMYFRDHLETSKEQENEVSWLSVRLSIFDIAAIIYLIILLIIHRRLRVIIRRFQSSTGNNT